MDGGKKEKYTGWFTYKDGYPEEYSTIRVDFEMELVNNKGDLIGTTIDSESKEIFPKGVPVEGFIKGKLISFKVIYPEAYYRDENNQLVRESGSPEHIVYYTGGYDHIKQEWSGEWEILAFEEEVSPGTYDQFFLTGEWAMKLND